MPCFAFYFSYKHIDSGLEIARVSEFLKTIEYENSAVVMNGGVTTVGTYLYYQFLRGKKSGEIYLLRSKPHSKVVSKFPEYSLILIEPDLSLESIFEKLKNNGKKRVYFIYLYLHDSSYIHQVIASNNFPVEKTSIYEAPGVQAILVELE
jgi:hypothetical protein